MSQHTRTRDGIDLMGRSQGVKRMAPFSLSFPLLWNLLWGDPFSARGFISILWAVAILYEVPPTALCSYLSDTCSNISDTTGASPSPSTRYPSGEKCNPSGAQRASPLLQLATGWSVKVQRLPGRSPHQA